MVPTNEARGERSGYWLLATLRFMGPRSDPRPIDRPLVLAHRGASAHAPDNSIEAYRLAVEQGADGIELDVRFTADGAVVLSHAASIPEFGALIDRPFADLRAAHPRVPTLDEMLPETENLILNVEIKNSPRDPDFDPEHLMAATIADWVETNGLESRALVSSFNPATVQRVKKLAPGVPTGLLLEHGIDIGEKLRDAADVGHEWLLPRSSALRIRPEKLVQDVWASGLRLGTWTVDAPRELRRLRRAGVDAVITNDPKRALAVYS